MTKFVIKYQFLFGCMIGFLFCLLQTGIDHIPAFVLGFGIGIIILYFVDKKGIL